jgi:2-iminobutanoate/2-iminopropanoate deaminase
MNPETIIDPGWTWDRPYGYSQAVRAGNLVFVSGQVPVDAEGKLVGPDDIRMQTRQVFENIKTVLKAADLALDDIVEIESYHTNMQDLGAMNEIKAEYLPHDFPAWTALGVTALAFPGQMLEIKVVAMSK